LQSFLEDVRRCKLYSTNPPPRGGISLGGQGGSRPPSGAPIYNEPTQVLDALTSVEDEPRPRHVIRGTPRSKPTRVGRIVALALGIPVVAAATAWIALRYVPRMKGNPPQPDIPVVFTNDAIAGAATDASAIVHQGARGDAAPAVSAPDAAVTPHSRHHHHRSSHHRSHSR
jgi:hypothetical protein